MKTFPASVLKVLIWVLATTTKICSIDRSSLAHAKPSTQTMCPPTHELIIFQSGNRDTYVNEWNTHDRYTHNPERKYQQCMRYKQTHKHTIVIRKFNYEQRIKFLDIGQLSLHT